jgi:hypothetical protein
MNFNFIGKVVETPTHIPGKRVGVKVVWKNKKFVGRLDKDLYDIKDWDNLEHCKWIYALPTNTYYPVWSRKPYQPPVEPDKNILAMTLRFWAKYRQGMTIYGKIVDGIFIEIKHHESDIPEAITE